MTLATAGALRVVAGKRDELISHLTRRSDALHDVG